MWHFFSIMIDHLSFVADSTQRLIRATFCAVIGKKIEKNVIKIFAVNT